ncbi:ThiF family adenylyltransferase [Sphaerisporangium corydalis]|uniref:ThiF family adenylyltransferase n=1 Tax=Sphaerisporangium corydalis TaxID=1441875 RepID=A0ABV9EF92_9ACTN|nr:ThiF family adenylyltransferase [Sphaerisporangium corydalis]
MTTTRLHSRDMRAGYDPERLARARVLVVGVGALGQNILQTLALSGVGNFLLVDFDRFEDHNATRSPFFPADGWGARYEGRKAPLVAMRALAASTATDPAIYYSTETVQQVGDTGIRWADVVVSAVDSVPARGWLAERSRLHATPMVEGGFSGSEFNFSSFSAEAGTVCYRCFNAERASSTSCTRYALELEREAIVPSIQTTAAVLAGYMTEQVMGIVHEDWAVYGTRSYGDVRRTRFETAVLPVHPRCPGEHVPLPDAGELPGGLATVGDLMAVLRDRYREGWLLLSEPVVLAQTCTVCLRMCQVRSLESSWMLDPVCVDCGGPWPLGDAREPDIATLVDFTLTPDDRLAATPLHDVGVRPGGSVVVEPLDTPQFLLHTPGTLPETCPRYLVP